MARRTFARGAAAVRQRRLSTWLFFGPAATTIATPPGPVLVGTLNAAALALRPFTVVRSHIEIQLESDQAASIERQVLGFGMVVVSDQAVDIGVTAIPTPITDLGSDLWFTHQLMFGDESDIVDVAHSATRVSIDSKAMRKVEVGQDIAIVLEMSSIGQGGVILSGGRLLVKVN